MDPIETDDPLEEERKKKKKKAKEQLGLDRTRTALERLQLAWMRFAITLSAFGFTIARILESKMAEGRQPVFGFIDGREIGLFMLAIGILGLVLATRQHVQENSKLRKLYEKMPGSVSLIMTYIVLAFCSFLFLVTLFRL